VVMGSESALIEAVSALIDNALKYTPANGQVRIHLTTEAGPGTVRLAVADSGDALPRPTASGCSRRSIGPRQCVRHVIPVRGLGYRLSRRW